MLFIKTNPAGIDVAIQRLQVFLHDKLKALWNIDETQTVKYRAYGRCYRNKHETSGYIAENYEGRNEYKEVYWDDSLSVLSFFGVANQVRHEKTKEQATVHLVFFVDLSKVKPSVGHRADEEVHKDLLTLIGNSLYGFDYTGLDTGVENVLRDYPGSRRDDRLKFVDMHPIHAFRLNFNILYDKNIC